MNFLTHSLPFFVMACLFLPCLSAIICACAIGKLSHKTVGWISCSLLGMSVLSSGLCGVVILQQELPMVMTLYEWGRVGALVFPVGFYLDSLSVTMMGIVSFIAWLVHIYSVGYMRADPGFTRFFSYIGFFTFTMLLLVTAHNGIQLFVGWEGVGLASYLLIGFWFEKETANCASLKAFLMNRIGDIGILVALCAMLIQYQSLEYAVILEKAGESFPLLPWIGLGLLVGAMGKSAQWPLHSWLPNSMEGPTPISALIHAATMVTAGIFVLARFSPVMMASPVSISTGILIGCITSVSMGIAALFQKDIKRVIAYSTLSQLGYMVVGVLSASPLSGLFHLGTHAFFKALLFLGAGAIILALHHEQALEKMGGLKKVLPLTHAMMLIGILSMVGFPGFSGFYSKEGILEALLETNLPVAMWAYRLLLVSVLITSWYSFWLYFKVFYGPLKTSPDLEASEYQSSIQYPLIILGVFSLALGAMVYPWLETGTDSVFYKALLGFFHTPFYLGLIGAGLGWGSVFYKPHWLIKIRGYYERLPAVYEKGISRCVKWCAEGTWIIGDKIVIDGMVVNGLPIQIRKIAGWIRYVQSGYLYHYALIMLTACMGIILWLIIR